MKWYLMTLKNYANFSGRARRKEYWMSTLVEGIIIGVMLAFITSSLFSLSVSMLNDQPVDTRQLAILTISYVMLALYSLATFLPRLAVIVRRLHDTDRSGWCIFVSLIPLVGVFILLYFLCQNGTVGNNQYGQDPKTGERLSAKINRINSLEDLSH